jgi:Flp pilus assembly protein TadG
VAAVIPPRARRSAWSSESGAELIEFALALPLLLLLGFGIMDFGLLFQRYEVITNAAREGARVAVLPGYSTADVIARVDQFMSASGLNAARPAPVIVTQTIPVGAQCASLTSVTVTYPQTLSMVAGIASYFGATGLGGRTGITATAQMRNEVPAGGCGP